jgi:hypothetical protein
VRSFIIESKGIDLAKAVQSITKEKARKDEVKSNGCLRVVKKEQTINILESDGNMIPYIKVKVSQLAPNNPGLEDVFFVPLEDDMGQSSYTMSKCPSGMLIEDI